MFFYFLYLMITGAFHPQALSCILNCIHIFCIIFFCLFSASVFSAIVYSLLMFDGLFTFKYLTLRKQKFSFCRWVCGHHQAGAPVSITGRPLPPRGNTSLPPGGFSLECSLTWAWPSPLNMQEDPTYLCHLNSPLLVPHVVVFANGAPLTGINANECVAPQEFKPLEDHSHEAVFVGGRNREEEIG